MVIGATFLLLVKVELGVSAAQRHGCANRSVVTQAPRGLEHKEARDRRNVSSEISHAIVQSLNVAVSTLASVLSHQHRRTLGGRLRQTPQLGIPDGHRSGVNKKAAL
jgi:hypothetical protein